MNLYSNMEKNYRKKVIDKMKGALRNERKNAFRVMFQSIFEQFKLQAGIKKEKRIMHQNITKNNKEKACRKEQSDNTTRFFNRIVRKLNDRINTSGDFVVHQGVFSHSSNGELNPIFAKGYLDYNLLYSLCYRNNIILNVEVDNCKKSAKMDFIVDYHQDISSDEFGERDDENSRKIKFFHRNYAFPHQVNPRRF